RMVGAVHPPLDASPTCTFGQVEVLPLSATLAGQLHAPPLGVGELDPVERRDPHPVPMVSQIESGSRRAYVRTRNRRMVASPDRMLLPGPRPTWVSPGGEKRMPSPSSTGRTYTRIKSTSPRPRHWPATSAPRISRFLPPAASRAVATASPMSPLRIVTAGSGGSGGSWVRTNTGPEKGEGLPLDADPPSLPASSLLPTS